MRMGCRVCVCVCVSGGGDLISPGLVLLIQYIMGLFIERGGSSCFNRGYHPLYEVAPRETIWAAHSGPGISPGLNPFRSSSECAISVITGTPQAGWMRLSFLPLL